MYQTIQWLDPFCFDITKLQKKIKPTQIPKSDNTALS